MADEVENENHDDTATAEVVKERKTRAKRQPVEKADDDVAHEVAVRRLTKPAESPMFPVKLLRNYHPVSDFTIDGREPTVEERQKVFAGISIEINVDEARTMIDKNIAVRNDPIR